MAFAEQLQIDKHAPVAIRRALLASLKLPAGQATVERCASEPVDHLVVRLSPGVRSADLPKTFEGYPVRYERLQPARASF